MIGGWLWDRKTTDAKARKILRNPGSREFITYAALLLSRIGRPKEALKNYIDPLVLCKHWASIKREMRRDNWNDARIVYWQVVYEYLLEKYRREGIVFRKEALPAKNPLCKETGSKLSEIRREQGLSQKEMAKKMGISQQLISRIEKGRENISVSTLANMAHALNRKIKISFVDIESR